MAKKKQQQPRRAQAKTAEAKETPSRRRREKKIVSWKFPLTRNNYIILGVGILIILIGYALMATGISDEPAVPDGTWNNPMAVNVAPTLLVIGYCVVIPFGLMKNFNKKKEEAK